MRQDVRANGSLPVHSCIPGRQQENLYSTVFVMLVIAPDGPEGQVGKGEP